MQRPTNFSGQLPGRVPALILLAAAFGLAACSSGKDGATGATGSTGENTLVSVKAEPAGANCPTGGQAVLSGVDADGNGVLDNAEVTSTKYVCNGPDGRSTLISTADEAPGVNCPAGGVAVHSGIDANSNGVLDSDEVSSTSYICDGTGAPDGGADGATDGGNDGATDGGNDGAADGGNDATAEASGGECTVDTDCPATFTCVDSVCSLSCATDACPTGYFCDPLALCQKKLCTTNADCTNVAFSECDQTVFMCVAPVVPVAPTIAGFHASPPAAVLGQPTPITFVWDLGTAPAYPAATCSISNGIGDVTGVATVVQPVTVTLLPLTFTLTCTNSAGSATSNVIIPGMPSTLVSLDVSPAGGIYQFGPAALDVPAGAVAQTTTISARLSNNFTPSPDLVSLPVEFYPDGFSFLQPVTLTLPIDTNILQPAGWDVTFGDLHVAVTGNDDWQVRIFTTADAVNQTLTAQIGHFSEVAGSASSTGSCDAPPISVPKKTLARRAEMLRLGSMHSTEGSGTGRVHDDLKQQDRDQMAHVTVPLGTDLAEGRMRATATGDFDGDNRDEVVVATRYKNGTRYAVRLFVLDGCHSSADAANCWNDFKVLKTIDIKEDDIGKSINDVSIATGDLDDDGLAEIAVVVSFDGGGGRLHRYDDGAHAYAEWINGYGRYEGNLEHCADLRVAVGDVNHRVTKDHAADIAIIGTYLDIAPHMSVMFVIKDAKNGGPSVDSSLIRDGDIFRQGSNHSRPNVALADIDNDGDAEIVAVAFHRGYTGLWVEAYKLGSDQKSFTRVDSQYYAAGSAWDNNMSPLIVGADLNGDGKSEVVVAERDANETHVLYWALGPAKNAWAQALIRDDFRDKGNSYLAAGDLDADLKDEVIIGEIRPDGLHYDFLAVTAAPPTNPPGKDRLIDKKEWQKSVGANKWDPLIAVGDFDGDSLTIKYTGECTTTTTDVRPAVAMAAPPVGLSLSQYRENSSTDYGTSSTTSESESNSVSTSDHVTLSLTASFLGGMFEASASATLQSEMTKTSTNTSSMTLGQSTSAPWLDSDYHNYVIYSDAEYVSYKYEIVAAPDKQALTSANKYMTIDVPQGENRYATTLETYNLKAPASKKIGSETFVHTLGDQSTYRPFYKCDDLIKNRGWKSADVWVAENASQSVSIEMSNEQASSEERSMSVEMEAGVSVAGVGFAYGRGYDKARAYDVSVGDSTEYSGTVGGLTSSPAGNWSTNKYKFRMVVYNFQRTKALGYTVIDYCVE